MNKNVGRTAGGRGACFAGVAAVLLVACAGGCNNAGEGAISGAGAGALTGLIIGSFTGNAGAGAAIGAATGGLGGAIIGDQNERRDRSYSREQMRARY